MEINIKKKCEEFTNMWKLIVILVNNQWAKEEITLEIREYSEIHKNKHTK